jgi:hypothetical protein
VEAGARVEGTSKVKEPVLGVEATMVRMGMTLVEGPWRRMREMLSRWGC